jgi:hypothetical protein
MEDTDIIKVISEGYKEHFGCTEPDVVPLPRSGSDRRYYRSMTAIKPL